MPERFGGMGHTAKRAGFWCGFAGFMPNPPPKIKTAPKGRSLLSAPKDQGPPSQTLALRSCGVRLLRQSCHAAFRTVSPQARPYQRSFS